MRKVELSLKEKQKYEIIKKLVETNGNKERARIKLGLKSIRQVNRLIAGYKDFGKDFFVHGNRGRKPKHALTDEFKDEIETLYTSKYFDCTYTQFTEYLAERENIFLSVPEVGQILRERYILSPRAHKITKKNLKKKLLAQKEKSKKEYKKFLEGHERSNFQQSLEWAEVKKPYWKPEVILAEDEQKILKNFALLTAKPVIYVANIGEDDLAKETNKYVEVVKEIAKKENAKVVALCTKIEEELAALDKDERQMFKEELGIKSSGLEKLVVASYDLLGLMSYLTAGEKEVRAWTITKGTKAPQAAGKIHTDFEKGFIKAEVVSYNDLVEAGSFLKAKEKGKVRMEGKEYVMQDGDVVLFRFNN